MGILLMLMLLVFVFGGFWFVQTYPKILSIVCGAKSPCSLENLITQLCCHSRLKSGLYIVCLIRLVAASTSWNSTMYFPQLIHLPEYENEQRIMHPSGGDAHGDGQWNGVSDGCGGKTNRQTHTQTGHSDGMDSRAPLDHVRTPR